MADKMEKSADELNKRDNFIGDGDIGITMKNGFSAIMTKTPEFPDDVGMSFMMCAQAFTSTRASSFATLFATGLMAAAKETKNMSEVPWERLPHILDVVIEKMALRGKSKLGDKTVLDELAGIRDALKDADNKHTLLETVDKAATQTLDHFRELPCKQGRARIFGNKTIGVDDPGMVVIRLLVESLKE